MATLLRDIRRRPTAQDPPPDGVDTTTERAPASGLGREVEFAGYADDCRIFGFIRVRADRMLDALNEAAEYALTDVMLVGLDDGLARQALELLVQRDDVLAVRASGPRGDPARRSRRRPWPVTLQTGPYVIHGYIHGLPGADPLQQIRRRKPMVPLTESWIEYRSGASTIVRGWAPSSSIMSYGIGFGCPTTRRSDCPISPRRRSRILGPRTSPATSGPIPVRSCS